VNQARWILFFGAITPSVIVPVQVQARSTGDTTISPSQSEPPAFALDQEALKSVLRGLSPIEKLRIAGDRIRLAKSNLRPMSRGGPTGDPSECVGEVVVCCAYRGTAALPAIRKAPQAHTNRPQQKK
jgi:hypothetical protein